LRVFFDKFLCTSIDREAVANITAIPFSYTLPLINLSITLYKSLGIVTGGNEEAFSRVIGIGTLPMVIRNAESYL
jgi:hypothetical protein